MRPRTEYHDARRLLIALLQQPDDGPVDLKGISDREKAFGTVTSAHLVILYQLCHAAGFDADEARVGLAKLSENAAAQIEEICTI